MEKRLHADIDLISPRGPIQIPANANRVEHIAHVRLRETVETVLNVMATCDITGLKPTV